MEGEHHQYYQSIHDHDDLQPFDSYLIICQWVTCDMTRATDRFGASYAGILAVSPWHEAWLIVASCHLACAVLIRVQFATHHQPLGTAAPLVVASFGIVKHDGGKSSCRSSKSGNNNTKHPKATCALKVVSLV